MPSVYMATRVILPSVRVPVLSVQMMEAEPRVSTAAILRISTFSFTMLLQPDGERDGDAQGQTLGNGSDGERHRDHDHEEPRGNSGSSGSLVPMEAPTMNTPRHTAMAM